MNQRNRLNFLEARECNSQSNAAPLKPKAFFNVIFFDEQFKAVDYKISMVGNNSTLKDHYAELQNIAIPKSGFVYIYCSNESPVNVFFDNLQVVHTRGAILEETHYYPFGLTMAGISSRAAGGMENKKSKYNGYELNKDFDINIYESFYRLHDPQVGRFWQVDPKTDSMSELTCYNSMANNPININDPKGDEIVFAKDATSQFKLDVIYSMITLLTKGVGKGIVQIAMSDNVYTLKETSGMTNSFSGYENGTGGLIEWNPNKCAVTKDNIFLSPTTLLNHEIDHAASYDRDYKAFLLRTTKEDSNYGDAEEKRVIIGMEQRTAKVMGEIKNGQITRDNHHAFTSYKYVTNPNSTSGPQYTPAQDLNPLIIKVKTKKKQL